MKKVLIAFVVIISMTQQTVTSRRSSWPRSGLWSTTSQAVSYTHLTLPTNREV